MNKGSILRIVKDISLLGPSHSDKEFGSDLYGIFEDLNDYVFAIIHF